MEGDIVLPSYNTSVDTLLCPANHVYPHPSPMAPMVRSLSPRSVAQSTVSELWPESLYPDCAPIYHASYQPMESECQPQWTNSSPPPLVESSKYIYFIFPGCLFKRIIVRDILSSALILNDIERETMMVTSADKLATYNSAGDGHQDVFGRY